MSLVDMFFAWCRRLANSGLMTLRLFTAVDASGALQPGSFTEANFPGYRSVPDEFWVSRECDGIVGRAFTGLLTWATTAAAPGQTVLGWYATLSVGGSQVLIGNCFFDSPVDMSQPGATKSIFAFLECFSITTQP